MPFRRSFSARARAARAAPSARSRDRARDPLRARVAGRGPRVAIFAPLAWAVGAVWWRAARRPHGAGDDAARPGDVARALDDRVRRRQHLRLLPATQPRWHRARWRVPRVGRDRPAAGAPLRRRLLCPPAGGAGAARGAPVLPTALGGVGPLRPGQRRARSLHAHRAHAHRVRGAAHAAVGPGHRGDGGAVDGVVPPRSRARRSRARRLGPGAGILTPWRRRAPRDGRFAAPSTR